MLYYSIIFYVIKKVRTFEQMGEAMIEVTNLTKRYGDHIAVNHLNFRVEKGQIYGFLGPNGAGKSTTMNMITGYLAPTEGTIIIDGIDIMKDPEQAKKKIGYLPEIPPLYMDMTVGEYLCFVADMKKVPRSKRAEKVNEVMEKTQITDMENRLIKNLSKGYRQRVGLAQAMLGDPEVLILDEPSVGLDPKQIIEIRELIKELGKNHTIILSSHILSEVSAVCDHIMIIAHGNLVASNSPDELQKQMSASMQLKLSVKGTREQLEEAIKDIPEIENVKISEVEPSTVIITLKEGADIREELFYRMVKADLPILQLESNKKSLEDIFLELTEDVAPAENKKRRLFSGKKEEKEEC